MDTLPAPDAQNGPPMPLAGHFAGHPPTPGKCHDVWLAVRVATVAESSEQAEQKAFDAFRDLVLARAESAEGKRAQIHLPPLLFNEVAIHVLNHMSGVNKTDL